MDERLILAYLFLCFSIGLTCLGVTVVAARRPGGQLARAFLVFYAALSVLVLSGLALAYVNTLSQPVSPTVRSILEYAEAIVGNYSVMFALPYFVHRVFGPTDGMRDRWLLLIIGLALVGQHLTEYVIGGVWDQRGDIAEDILLGAVVAYTIGFAFRRFKGPVPDRGLARKVLVMLVLWVPAMAYDLFFGEATGFRIYPLGYCIISLIVTRDLARAPVAKPAGAAPDWGLSRREAEVFQLVAQGLSNKDIAERLHISPNTVKTHLRALFEKSGARSRFELISKAAGVQGPRETPKPEEKALPAGNHLGG